MLSQNKQVAVVGGGPGGLTLARLLQMQGANVKVYERDRDKNARVQGSPLDLHDGSGLAAIHKANLSDAFKSNFMPGADKMLIVDAAATVRYSDHESETEEDFGSRHFRPEIDRGTLRKILLESLQPGTMVWDSHFIHMEPQDEGWLLHFKDGFTAYADIVIAADGANSKIRPYITGIKPAYSGVTMLEGNVYHAKKATPHIYELLNGGKIMAFGNTKNLLMGFKENGEIGFYASLKVPENWASKNGLDYTDNAQLLSWFKKEYSGWSSIWDELFEKATAPFIPRPIYYMPPGQTWNAMPNVTMLGDAAHVMPPFAGEGANMAMLDALELSISLTSGQYGSVQEAIADYETKMRERSAVAIQESLDNGELMHSPDALQNMLEMFGGHSAL